MLEKNIITKIALGVAAAAFIFSLTTLIRAIIIGAGVPFAAIQVIGTLIIVSICGIMLYVLRKEESEESSEENENNDDDFSEEAQSSDDEPSPGIYEPEEAEPYDNDDKYNFSTFE